MNFDFVIPTEARFFSNSLADLKVVFACLRKFIVAAVVLMDDASIGSFGLRTSFSEDSSLIFIHALPSAEAQLQLAIQ